MSQVRVTKPVLCARALGGLPTQAEKFQFAGMKLFERRTYDMKCNWKTYVDNYLEGYHLPSVHPGLNRELDFNAYVVEPHAGYVRQFSPIRGAQPGDATPRRYPEAREDLTTDYFWIFPNWMLNCYPDNVSLNIVLPVEPERSLAIFEWYLPEKDHGSPAAKASVEFSDQIQVGRCWHLRESAEESALAQLFPRALQREAGEGCARFSSDVCGRDERTLTAENAEVAEKYFWQRCCRDISRRSLRARRWIAFLIPLLPAGRLRHRAAESSRRRDPALP